MKHIIREYIRTVLSEDPTRPEKTGGAALTGPHIKKRMKVSDILGLDVAYIKAVEEVDADPEHPDRNRWDVYANVKEIQDGLQSGDAGSNISRLRPIQIVGNRVVDGAHRMNAINLISKEDPSVLNLELKVEEFSEDVYRNHLRLTGKKL